MSHGFFLFTFIHLGLLTGSSQLLNKESAKEVERGEKEGREIGRTQGQEGRKGEREDSRTGRER